MLFPYMRADGFPLTAEESHTSSVWHLSLSVTHLPPYSSGLASWDPTVGTLCGRLIRLPVISSLNHSFSFFCALHPLAHPIFYFQYSSSLNFIAVFHMKPFPSTQLAIISLFSEYVCDLCILCVHVYIILCQILCFFIAI